MPTPGRGEADAVSCLPVPIEAQGSASKLTDPHCKIVLAVGTRYFGVWPQQATVSVWSALTRGDTASTAASATNKPIAALRTFSSVVYRGPVPLDAVTGHTYARISEQVAQELSLLSRAAQRNLASCGRSSVMSVSSAARWWDRLGRGYRKAPRAAERVPEMADRRPLWRRRP